MKIKPMLDLINNKINLFFKNPTYNKPDIILKDIVRCFFSCMSDKERNGNNNILFDIENEIKKLRKKRNEKNKIEKKNIEGIIEDNVILNEILKNRIAEREEMEKEVIKLQKEFNKIKFGME